LAGSLSAEDVEYAAEQTAREKAENRKTEEDAEGGFYYCPLDGHNRLFRRLSSLE